MLCGYNIYPLSVVLHNQVAVQNPLSREPMLHWNPNPTLAVILSELEECSEPEIRSTYVAMFPPGIPHNLKQIW